MGYDMKIIKGTKLIISISGFDEKNGTKPVWTKEFKIPVKKGQEIYHEIYVKDGDYDTC